MPQRLTRTGLLNHLGEEVRLQRDGKEVSGHLFEDDRDSHLFIQGKKGSPKYTPRDGERVLVLIHRSRWSGYTFRPYTYSETA